MPINLELLIEPEYRGDDGTVVPGWKRRAGVTYQLWWAKILRRELLARRAIGGVSVKDIINRNDSQESNEAILAFQAHTKWLLEASTTWHACKESRLLMVNGNYARNKYVTPYTVATALLSLASWQITYANVETEDPSVNEISCRRDPIRSPAMVLPPDHEIPTHFSHNMTAEIENEPQSGTIVLTYFCGQDDSAYPGVIRVAKSLLYQLFWHDGALDIFAEDEAEMILKQDQEHRRAHPFRKPEENLKIWREDADHKNYLTHLDACLKAIGRLVRTFAAQGYKIFIIIDGIDIHTDLKIESLDGEAREVAEFEEKESKASAEALLKFLAQLVDAEEARESSTGFVKVLVTATKNCDVWPEQNGARRALIDAPKALTSVPKRYGTEEWKELMVSLGLWSGPFNDYIYVDGPDTSEERDLTGVLF